MVLWMIAISSDKPVFISPLNGIILMNIYQKETRVIFLLILVYYLLCRPN